MTRGLPMFLLPPAAAVAVAVAVKVEAVVVEERAGMVLQEVRLNRPVLPEVLPGAVNGSNSNHAPRPARVAGRVLAHGYGLQIPLCKPQAHVRQLPAAGKASLSREVVVRAPHPSSRSGSMRYHVSCEREAPRRLSGDRQMPSRAS